MPKGVSGVTIKKNGVLKHDEEGFVTPMKIKLNKLIKVCENICKELPFDMKPTWFFVCLRKLIALLIKVPITEPQIISVPEIFVA